MRVDKYMKSLRHKACIARWTRRVAYCEVMCGLG